MAKSKKTRQKRPDFQKVKLKVGKRLPRSADNVTQTSFKTRTIQMRERRSSKDGQRWPTEKRKVNIQELMSQSRHSNVHVRLEAIAGLRRALTADDNLLHQCLVDILGIACELFVDRDASVRDATIRTLRSILPRVSANQISPFFPLISAHLSCAMTHIDDVIRAASLPLLDVCLDHYAALVAGEGNDRLLHDFVGLVSHRKRSANAASSTSIQQRSLTVNPASRLSEQKWRTKVLSRLHRYLKAIVDNRPTLSKNNSSAVKNVKADVIICHGDSFDGYLPLGCAAVTGKPGFNLRSTQPVSTSTNVDGAADMFSTITGIQTCFHMLVPLLLECWVEVAPAHSENDVPGNILSSDTLAILDSVLGILLLLLKLATENCDTTSGPSISWVHQKYKKDFIHYFMANFPYCTQAETAKSKTKSANVQQQLSIISLNLAVCEVMTHMLDTTAGSRHPSSSSWIPDWFSPVNQYVHNQLAAGGGRPNHADLTRLMHMTRLHMSLPLPSDKKKKLLSAMSRLHHNVHPQSSSFLLLFREFSDLIFHHHHKELASTPVAERWLASLLQTLLQTAPENEATISLVLDSICLARSQGHAAFLRSLGDQLGDFLSESFLPQLSHDLQRRAVEILYHVPRMQRSHFVQVVSLSRRLNTSALWCLLQILHVRFTASCSKTSNRKESPFDTSDYISFLISLALGTSREQLNLNIEVTLDETAWQRHITTVDRVVKIFSLFPDVTQVWSLVGATLQKLTRNKSTLLPATAALSVLSLSQHTPLSSACWEGLISLIVGRLLAENTTEAEESHMTKTIFNVCVSLLGSVDGLLDAVVNEMMRLLQEAPLLAQAENTTTVLTKLLNTAECKLAITKCQNSLIAVCEFIQTNFDGELNQQWWADFKYVLSLAGLQPTPAGGATVS